MKLYKIFVVAFIVTMITLIAFLIFYFAGIMQVAGNANNPALQQDPYLILRSIFSPGLIISFVICILATLTYQILGIVFIARNPTLESGEKIIWILGFIMFSFITAIVFMALKNSKNLLATGNPPASPYSSLHHP